MFSPTPRGKRKVIISTNIAETSLTLEVMLSQFHINRSVIQSQYAILSHKRILVLCFRV